MRWFKKRTPDWWFFTLLPLLLFLLIVLIIKGDTESSIVLLITQQLYFYSVILSSTEIGLRFKLNQEIEEDSRFKDSWQGIFILIFSSILLAVSYFRKDIFNSYDSLFFITSLLFTVGSIWLSNINEYSGIGNLNFGQQRREQGKAFSKKIETKEPYKGVKIG